MTSHRQLHPTQDLDTNAPAISIRGLHKSFGEVKVLEGIDLDVHRGQVVCVIGPSGSGKSTLLRCVNRLEEPTAGQILIEGVDITDPDTELDAVRSRIGMVFQSFNLFSHMSVLRNLTLAQQKVKRRGRKEAVAIAMENLERVGLAHRAEAARYARPSTDAGDAAAADTLRKQLLTWLDHDESAVDRTRRRLFPSSATR